MQHPVNTRKKWVQELAGPLREELASTLGVPIGAMLGCGAFGCAFESEPPWVVKLTQDATEARMWEYIINLLRKEDRGQGGFTRVKEVVRLRRKQRKSEPGRPVYAVIREAIEPVFGPREPYYLTEASYARLGIDPAHEGPIQAGFIKRHRLDRSALIYQLTERGVEPHRAEQYAEHTDNFWDTIQALGMYRHRELEHRAGMISKERLVEAATRIAYGMRGWIGLGLGDSLELLADHGIVLRDVHLLNVGWRTHVEVPGFADETRGLVIFDPGITPTPYQPQIEERQLARNGRLARWLIPR